MIELQECLRIIEEYQDDKKSAKVLAGKFRTMEAEEVARLLLALIVDYDMEEFVTEVLGILDRMSISYFEAILNYNQQLDELYNN